MCKTQQASQIILVQNCTARQREVKADVSSYQTLLCNMLQRIKNKNQQCKNLILLLNTTRSFPFSEHLRTSRTTSAKIMLVSQAAVRRRVRTEATTNWNEEQQRSKKEKKKKIKKWWEKRNGRNEFPLSIYATAGLHEREEWDVKFLQLARVNYAGCKWRKKRRVSPGRRTA